MGPWGKVGNNGPVDVVWTDENIQHLGRSDVCKIPAKTTKRVVCKNGSAVYIRNLEVGGPFSLCASVGNVVLIQLVQDQETAYKCVNYLYSTQGVFQECSDFHRTFGPAYSDGSKWATILVGDSC